jgi:hypothetical protein
MLTPKDKEYLDNTIGQKLADFLPNIIEAFKLVFATKDDFEGLREDFSKLQSSVDGFMKKVETAATERVAMGSRLDRHEKWIKHVAEKTNVKLES